MLCKLRKIHYIGKDVVDIRVAESVSENAANPMGLGTRSSDFRKPPAAPMDTSPGQRLAAKARAVNFHRNQA